MDIEELIRYHNESEYLDFKLQEYLRADKTELVKDVLAFANAETPGDRYIIIGMKKIAGETRFNPIIAPRDAAEIEQTVHNNVRPELKITYEPFIFEGHQLVVLTICKPADQPYVAAKDLPGLRENELHIRKGSFKKLISRTDLDRIYRQKFRPATLDGQVSITFVDGSTTLTVPCARNILLPSQRNKHEIEEQIRWKEELISTDPKTYSQRFGNHRGLQNSYAEMDLPTLRSRLETVQMNYQDEDKHYLQETRAYRLQLVLRNNGEQHLEKAMVILTFPELSGLLIAQRIAPTTYQQAIVTGIDYNTGYPIVSNSDAQINITSEPGEVRHKLPANVFQQPLRLFVPEVLVGHSLKFSATIYGRNLLAPQFQVLELHFT